jgi:ribosomal protein S18 acetylase RimI-like enzyme
VAWPHPDHVLVETLAVAPGAQGAGIGTALLDRSEILAIEGGSNVVRLSTNAAMTDALAYSRRHGFAEVGRGSEHGFDRVHLEKRLA